MVNAVLVLILVSVLASTIVGTRASARVSSPSGPRPLGTRVVVGVGEPQLALGALTLARRIARADGGVVHPLLVVPETAPFAPRSALAALGEVIAAAGVDGAVLTIVDRSVLHGALRVGRSQEATLVLVAEPAADESQPASPPLPAAARERAREHSPAPPVAVVRGNAGRLGVVRMRLEDEERQAPSIAEEMACRVASGPAQRLDDDHADWSELLAPGDVTFVSSELGDTLGKLPGAADGLVVSTVAEWLIREESAGDATPELPGEATALWRTPSRPEPDGA